MLQAKLPILPVGAQLEPEDGLGAKGEAPVIRPGIDSWTCRLGAEGHWSICASSEVASLGLHLLGLRVPPSRCPGEGKGWRPMLGVPSAAPVLAQAS